MRYFYHHGQCGDIIYSIPTIQAFGGGTLITGLKKNLHRALEPLLRSQPCISDVKHVEDFGIPKGTIILDDFRMHPKIDSEHLVNCHLEMFGFSKYDFTKPWLKANIKGEYGYSIINVTERYRDKFFNWKKEIERLRKINGDYIYFMGTEKEYKDFCEKYGCYAGHIKTKDFLEATEWIKDARIFSGNQSALMAIRQGLGLKYRIHRSPYMANCNQWNKKETVINSISRRLHILGVAIKKFLKG